MKNKRVRHDRIVERYKSKEPCEENISLFQKNMYKIQNGFFKDENNNREHFDGAVEYNDQNEDEDEDNEDDDVMIKNFDDQDIVIKITNNDDTSIKKKSQSVDGVRHWDISNIFPTTSTASSDMFSDDNEDNAIIASKIFFDIHKTFRPNLESQVQVRHCNTIYKHF